MDQLSAREKVRESLHQNHQWIVEKYKNLNLINADGYASSTVLAMALQTASNLTIAEMIAEQLDNGE